MSCEEGEILPPTGNTFTVTASESATYTTNDFEVGESVSVSVDIVASQGIGLFGIDKVVNEGAAQDITANFTNLPSPGATSFSGTYEVSVSENVGDMVQIIIRSSPQGGTAFTSDTYTYDVVAQGQGGGGGVFPLLRSQVSVALGAQGTPATGSYLNTSNGTVYLNAEASALSNAEKAAIDITFGVVGTTTPTIISPDE